MKISLANQDKAGEAKANECKALVYYYKNNWTKAKSYFQKAELVYSAEGMKQEEADLLYYLASISIAEKHKDEFIAYSEKIEEIAISIHAENILLKAYTQRAYFCQTNEDFQNALDFYFKSLEIAEKINDKKYLGGSYHGLAVVYEDYLNDYEQAKHYLLLAIKIKEEIKPCNDV